METKYSYVSFIAIFYLLHALVSANLCPDSTLCNCILTDGVDLQITCTSTLSPSKLPTLNNSTLQAGVTTLYVRSSTAGSAGPLTSLPTNLCSAYPNVNILDFASNSISGLFNTSQLACLGSNLISINLSNNFISEIDSNFFQSNRALQTIDFSQNNLAVMPLIDYFYFFNFVTSITFMNFSYNQITQVDFWPIFVKTQQAMLIDMSHNLIGNFTNTVPVFVKDFTEPPDPRTFYLNDNQLEHFSDLLLEQYGACATFGNTSTPYFIVGVSNVLLTDNPLICDCQSYNLVTFINTHLYEYPMLYNRSALLTEAQCTLPNAQIEQSFLFSNYTSWDLCKDYTLPSISNAYCSAYANTTISTLAAPVYTSPTTTALSTSGDGSQTTTDSESVPGESGTNTRSSGSPSWYIILGIVLGFLLLFFLIALACCILLPERCRSKFFRNNLNNTYEPFNGRQTSRSASDDGTNLNAYHSWDGKIHPAHETQTCFQIVRSKPSKDPPTIRRAPQKLRMPPGTKTDDDPSTANPSRKRKTSPSPADAAPESNSTHVIKGIPLMDLAKKGSSASSNGSDAPADSSTFEMSMMSIPLTPSKRAKLLPPLKGGTFIDSSSNHLLNTSAGGARANHRQRRLSATWSHRQNASFVASSASRRPSQNMPKNVYHDDGSSEDEKSSVPTVEGLTKKSPKPLRALPLLNITAVPARTENEK